MRAYDDCARLDAEAESDDALWAARMRAATEPLPEWRLCDACDEFGRAADGGPWRVCEGVSNG